MAVLFPIGSLQRDETAISMIDHSHSLFLIIGDDPEGFIGDESFSSHVRLVRSRMSRGYVGVESLFGFIRFEPFFEQLELFFVRRGLRQGDSKLAICQV